MVVLPLFAYNWQVRDEWFAWCNQLSAEQLGKDRTGGPGSILYTLFHIVDVEYSWIRGIMGETDVVFNFEDYNTLEKVCALSHTLRSEIVDFLQTLAGGCQEGLEEYVTVAWDENPYTKQEILLHIVAHEIHHMGQLSVWARELGLRPVSANVIGRKWNLPLTD